MPFKTNKKKTLKEIKKYPKTLIIIHWLTFLLFIFVFVVGNILEDFNEKNFNTYRLHAIPGMLILVLTIIRIIIKRKNSNNLPAEISYYNKSHKLFVNIVMILIYLLLILTPLVGFIMVYQTGALNYDLGGPFPTGAELNETLAELHEVLVKMLLALIAIHVSGVIIYKFKTGENLLKRIRLFLK